MIETLIGLGSLLGLACAFLVFVYGCVQSEYPLVLGAAATLYLIYSYLEEWSRLRERP